MLNGPVPSLPFSRLEYLHIHGHFENFDISILQHFPTLVELHLEASDRAHPPGWFDIGQLGGDFQLSSLRRLTVKNFIVHCTAGLLIMAPSVEDVTLTNTAGQTLFTANGFPTDALSQLKRLTVIPHHSTIRPIPKRKYFANILQLIEDSSLPRLEELWLNDTLQDAFVQKRLPKLLSRVSRTLKRFSMRIHADFHTDSLAEVLRTFSAKTYSLHHLRLCNAETETLSVAAVDETWILLLAEAATRRDFPSLEVLEYYTPSLDPHHFGPGDFQDSRFFEIF